LHILILKTNQKKQKGIRKDILMLVNIHKKGRGNMTVKTTKQLAKEYEMSYQKMASIIQKNGVNATGLKKEKESNYIWTYNEQIQITIKKLVDKYKEQLKKRGLN
jgi:hypothetical protein